MAQCTDKHFREMLYAYELGLLTDRERSELEMHLLDCPPCRKELLELRETIVLLRGDRDVRKAIELLGKEEEEAAEAELEKSEPKKRRRLLPTLVPATVLALVVVFLLVLKPWQIEISPSQEAIAARNRLAIMYFDNISDPADSLCLGQILTNLLITDLAESHYIQVVSHQRMYDILRLLELENIKRIDGETATVIAEQAGAQWMLMGNILQVQPQLVVTAQLVEVQSGNIVASQRVTGEVDETVFSLVDKLSAEIKSDLSLPAEAQSEVDRPVAEVTSYSAEAYRLYLEGVDDWYKLYLDDASDKFRQALALDSTLAMAYYYLAIIKDRAWIEKAVQYAEKASQKEKLYIKSRALLFEDKTEEAIDVLKKMIGRFPDEKLAYFVLGTLYYTIRDYESSVKAEKKALEIDPLYTAALNQLAYSNFHAGDTAGAIEALNKYIALEPNEANPYDSRGELLARSGKIEEAIASYKQALEKKPDFRSSIGQLVLMNILDQNYDAAEEYAKSYIASADSMDKWSAIMYTVYIPQYQGKFNATLKLLDDIIARMKKELGEEKYIMYRHTKTIIYGAQGRWDLALAEVEECMNLSRRLRPEKVGEYLESYVHILAESGNIERALHVADSIKMLNTEKGAKLEPDYAFAMSTIEMARGNPGAAAKYLKDFNSMVWSFAYAAHYQLGRAYLAMDLPEKALQEFQDILSHIGPHLFYWGAWTVKSHYFSGLAYEKLGESDKAIESYAKFLDILKNADSETAEMEDARARLARLQTKS